MAAEAVTPNQQKPENPILSFFSNLLALIKLPLPFNKNNKKTAEYDAASPQSDSAVQAIEKEEAAEAVPDEVTFPRKQDFPVLKLEGRDAETNPLLLWQVYAIGGFFVLRWAWSRWNERKGQKKSDDDTSPDS